MLTAFEVTTSHTPFQLVYGLHPFMLTNYLLATQFMTHTKLSTKLIKVFTSRIIILT